MSMGEWDDTQIPGRRTPPRPAPVSWPDGEAGSLHVDAEQLTRVLGPLRQRVEELQGSARGGVTDFGSRVAGVGGSMFGNWLTAGRVGDFHTRAHTEHAAVFGAALAQVLQVVRAAEVCVANVHEADAQSKAAFDAAAGGVGSGSPVAGGSSPVDKLGPPPVVTGW
jgi:hypothetical protein